MPPTGTNSPPPSPSAGPVEWLFHALNRILDFLFAKFDRLPRRLRPVAYFIFLGFFCATAWRLVAGEYVVRGVIWDGDRFAEACEIRLRGDYFSTNSKGMYYAVLSPQQYFRFAVTDPIDLPIMCRRNGSLQRVPGPFKVTLSLWDDELSEVDLRAPYRGEASGAFSFGLARSAYAQPPQERATQPPDLSSRPAAPSASTFPSSGDRLVIERITLGEGARKMRQVEFEVELGKEERPLLLQGAEAGDLPMRSVVTLGEKYYFDLPQERRGTRVNIEMEGPGLFGREEDFEFDLPAQYDTAFPVRGDKDSILILRLVPGAS